MCVLPFLRSACNTRAHNNIAPTFFDFDLLPYFQMLIVATRERDAANAQIEGLRRELSLYLSVPAEGKLPRTTMTRVGRMPLVPVTRSENVNHDLPPLADGVMDGEMTLDEIT